MAKTYFGSGLMTAIYLGSNEITKVYLGSALVFGDSTPPPVAIPQIYMDFYIGMNVETNANNNYTDKFYVGEDVEKQV